MRADREPSEEIEKERVLRVVECRTADHTIHTPGVCLPDCLLRLPDSVGLVDPSLTLCIVALPLPPQLFPSFSRTGSPTWRHSTPGVPVQTSTATANDRTGNARRRRRCERVRWNVALATATWILWEIVFAVFCWVSSWWTVDRKLIAGYDKGSAKLSLLVEKKVEAL